MSRYDAEAELRERQRVQEEVKVLGGMIDDVTSARAQDAKCPLVAMSRDMWPPHFVAGAICKVHFVRCEQVERGRFILVRYKGKVHVVRFIGWKFKEGRTVLEFIPGPTDHRVVSSGDVELLGEVLSVVDERSGKEVDPHKVSFFTKIWNVATTYGTAGFWSGLYRFLDSFVVDTSSAKHEKKRHKDSIWKMWHKLEGWRTEVEERKQAEDAQRLARKRNKKKHWDELEFDADTIDNLPEDHYDEVKEKLAKTSDADMASWWTPSERMDQARSAATAPRPRRPKR